VGATADGAFGPLTKAAVVRTQSQLHVPATGVVDLPTFTAFGLVGTVACTVAAVTPVAATPPPPPASIQQTTAQAVAAQVTALRARPDSAVSGTAATVIAFARAQLGVPYLTGGTTRAGYDCSGLVLASYGAAGLGLNRTAAAQYAQGINVPLTALAPGDTVFFATDLTKAATIYHTAIYIGGGQMIEAAKPGTLVRQVPLRTADLFPAGARPSALIVLPAANTSSGFTARAIQSRLVAHGFIVSVDGALGPKTAAAVAAFQRAIGQPANGVVDAATWAALSR
jgi:cell wall-associated NlpC family hydrolase